jgi:type IV secretion system protein VirB5
MKHVYSTAILSLLIALAAVVGMIWIGSQTKFVPYLVKVDKLGESAAVNPAPETTPADPRIITAEMARWVYDM